MIARSNLKNAEEAFAGWQLGRRSFYNRLTNKADVTISGRNLQPLTILLDTSGFDEVWSHRAPANAGKDTPR